ncbi:MAG: aKG-HExxH-type peptide beta-hydroxylase [Steroidobacteraceae bacterium]
MNSAPLERGIATGFFYLDLKDTRRRAVLLAAAVRNKIPSIESLKHEYARALRQINGAPLSTARQPRIVAGGPILRAAKAKGLVDNSVRASGYGSASRTVAMRHALHGLLLLRLQHPPLGELCDLLVTDILCWPSVELRGGSAADLLGIVWIVPSAELTSFDMAEFVIHEMVHMNLTLADMTVGLFTRAPGSHFKAHSAVLGRRRPHDLVFHSACVAVALIYFRLLAGLHGEVDWLRSSLQRCTAELLHHRAAFTECSWNAILAAHAFSRAPRLEAIPVHKDLTRLL